MAEALRQMKPKTARSRSTDSIVPNGANILRERVVRELRKEGYRLREIAEFLRITRQRVCQIEQQIIIRDETIKTKQRRRVRTANRSNPVQLKSFRLRAITRAITEDDFESRLDAINLSFQARFDAVLRRQYGRQTVLDRTEPSMPTLFWKLWPFIEIYKESTFTFSELVRDFPELARLPHLPQLLFRLRKSGVLRKTGLSRVAGHNLPEVLMAERPIEEYAAATMESVVVRWSTTLQHLDWTYRTVSPERSIQLLRERLIQNLREKGLSASEIESICAARSRKAEVVREEFVPRDSAMMTEVSR